MKITKTITVELELGKMWEQKPIPGTQEYTTYVYPILNHGKEVGQIRCFKAPRQTGETDENGEVLERWHFDSSVSFGGWYGYCHFKNIEDALKEDLQDIITEMDGRETASRPVTEDEEERIVQSTAPMVNMLLRKD